MNYNEFSVQKLVIIIINGFDVAKINEQIRKNKWIKNYSWFFRRSCWFISRFSFLPFFSFSFSIFSFSFSTFFLFRLRGQRPPLPLPFFIILLYSVLKNHIEYSCTQGNTPPMQQKPENIATTKS